ncbi:unnamed protein product [Heterobilharzia americana]|nr:unnamed protein product [Heterobilharzia americana]
MLSVARSTSNIQVSENGLAHVTQTSRKSTNNLTDWLTVLSETLEPHTLWDHTQFTNSLESSVEMWKKSCLYLCITEEQRYLSTSKTDTPQCFLLQNLQKRSNKAEKYESLGGESQQRKNAILRQFTSSLCPRSCDDISIRRETAYGDESQRKDDEKSAFIQWAERWRCVNTEFTARQLISDPKRFHNENLTNAPGKKLIVMNP